MQLTLSLKAPGDMIQPLHLRCDLLDSNLHSHIKLVPLHLATRVFLKRFQEKFPSVPLLALVDWNPSGLLILQTYRSGGGILQFECNRPP